MAIVAGWSKIRVATFGKSPLPGEYNPEIFSRRSKMVQIARGNDVVTLINIFTVSPENQQKLVDMLIEATEKTMQYIPGFVSASFHKSADGTRVANYAQ